MIGDLLLGRSWFKEFAISPEGAPTHILSDRLSRLVALGVAEKVLADAGASVSPTG